MHPLRQYLGDVKETVQNFSARVGISRQTLYRIVNDRQAPKPALARRIVEATGGVVSFDALYRARGGGAEIVALERTADEGNALDFRRILMSLSVVANQLTPQCAKGPPEQALEIAAEAAINTFVALEKVTTRQGPDRLRQALRPVLEEILTEYLAFAPPAAALDEGANLASIIYYQMVKSGMRPVA